MAAFLTAKPPKPHAFITQPLQASCSIPVYGFLLVTISPQLASLALNNIDAVNIMDLVNGITISSNPNFSFPNFNYPSFNYPNFNCPNFSEIKLPKLNISFFYDLLSGTSSNYTCPPKDITNLGDPKIINPKNFINSIGCVTQDCMTPKFGFRGFNPISHEFYNLHPNMIGLGKPLISLLAPLALYNSVIPVADTLTVFFNRIPPLPITNNLNELHAQIIQQFNSIRSVIGRTHGRLGLLGNLVTNYRGTHLVVTQTLTGVIGSIVGENIRTIDLTPIYNDMLTDAHNMIRSLTGMMASLRLSI
jgi:hypothetical protein